MATKSALTALFVQKTRRVGRHHDGTMGAGLRPDAKATEPPPDPTVGAPVPDSTLHPLELL